MLWVVLVPDRRMIRIVVVVLRGVFVLFLGMLIVSVQCHHHHPHRYRTRRRIMMMIDGDDVVAPSYCCCVVVFGVFVLVVEERMVRHTCYCRYGQDDDIDDEDDALPLD